MSYLNSVSQLAVPKNFLHGQELNSSHPVLIQLCIITSTRSIDSGLEVLTVSCNI